jgi:large subunit ribosomal protein L24
LQTTLLSIAVAVILALVAALVGPSFIDWGTYRSLFEKEASRLTGLDVHVRGAIDAQLLPSPRLQLHDIEIGQAGGNDALRANSLAIEFALGPLLRAEWRASEMHLSAPEIHLGIDRAGIIDGPAFAFRFDPDALSIDRLSVDGGKVVLADAASGATVVLDKLWFNGELRSLLGPLKGEGAATIHGELYPYRLSTGRAKSDGALRVRLNVDPVNKPLNLETDGILSVVDGKAQFQGAWSLARPVGIASHDANALVTQPWRLGGKVKLTPASALMEQVDFQYGSDAEALKLTGTAELKFGERPRFDGVLSARQIDVDRLAGEDGAQHTPPAATLRRLAGLAGQAFRPPIPIQIGVGIDAVTLGGADLQNVRGDISTAAGGWTLDRFEFRAPGFTDVRLSGRLGFEPSGAVFTGPAEINANDPGALAAWLEGRKDQPRAPPRPLRMRGEVTLGNERMAIERLSARFDRGTLSGRFAYTFGPADRGTRIDADLTAPELDIDAGAAFVRALLAGSELERPSEAALALDIGRASYAGIEAGKTVARLQYDASGLNIQQLTIDNLGGANLAARGQIALTPAPHGNLSLDLDARDLTGVGALLSRYAPDVTARLVGAMPSLAPAKLHTSLTIAGTTSPSKVSFAVAGTAGTLRVNLDGAASGDLGAIDAAKLQLRGKLDADDGHVLASLLGLDRLAAIGKQPANLTLNASGPALGQLNVDSRMIAGGFDASANGMIQFAPGRDMRAAVKLAVAQADVSPLRNGGPPVSGAINLKLDGKSINASDIVGTIAGSTVRGNLTVGLDDPRKVAGELDLDTIDAAALLGAAIGTPTGAIVSGWVWRPEPFAGGWPGNYDGTVSLRAMRASLTPSLAAREFRAQLRVMPGALSLDNVTGAVAGGDLSGNLTLSRSGEGLSARGKVALNNADVSSFLPASARPPLAGRLALQAEFEGSGRSPVALIGSLQGAGKITLTGAQLAGLDPRVFSVVTRAVDQGLPVEAAKIESLAGSALESGQLFVRQVDGSIVVTAGQIRLGNAAAKGEGADISVGGSLDLTNGKLDARLVLTGADMAADAKPDIFVALRGPLDAPAKSVDVSALTGWLTLRAVERQTKKLEAIESAPKPELKPELKPEPKPELKPELEQKSEQQSQRGPALSPAAQPAAPAQILPPKPKETATPKRPPAVAPARRAEQAPALPAPINILPAVMPAAPNATQKGPPRAGPNAPANP